MSSVVNIKQVTIPKSVFEDFTEAITKINLKIKTLQIQPV